MNRQCEAATWKHGGAGGLLVTRGMELRHHSCLHNSFLLPLASICPDAAKAVMGASAEETAQV